MSYAFRFGELPVGVGHPVSVSAVSGLGLGPVRASEHPLPTGDGVRFGREFRDPGPISFEGSIVGVSVEQVFELAGVLGAECDAAGVRAVSGAVSSVWVSRPGSSDRALLGRWERLDVDLETVGSGVVAWSAVFRPVVPGVLGGVRSVAVRQGASVQGGIVTTGSGGVPSPIVTVAASRRASWLEVGGDVVAWPVVEFRGPVVDPRVEVLDESSEVVWSAGWRGTVGEGRSVRLDARPWSRGVTRTGGGWSGGQVDARTRLTRMELAPGVFEARFSGADVTGTAECEISWRDRFAVV